MPENAKTFEPGARAHTPVINMPSQLLYLLPLGPASLAVHKGTYSISYFLPERAVSACAGGLIEVTEILNRFLDCYLRARAKHTPSGTHGNDGDSLRPDNSLESGSQVPRGS
jgi:hypothetical protein